MEDIISPNQPGFVKGRFSYTNIRRLLWEIHSSASSAWMGNSKAEKNSQMEIPFCCAGEVLFLTRDHMLD